MTRQLNFYRPGDPFGCFSNFSRHPITVNGVTWRTSEHYYQAQKFTEAADRDAVWAALTPRAAADIGRDRSRSLRPDWDLVKDEVMFTAVLAKVEQHFDVRSALLSTEDAVLVEHTRNDSYWGDGGDGSGRNQLGLTLMAVRDLLRCSPLLEP